MPELSEALGKWVTGNDFWDREKDIEIFMERIEQGAHQLLVAQRRTGKTSLLKETERRINQEGRYLCLFVDFQKAQCAPDAIVDLSLAVKPYQSLWKKTTDVFSNVLNKIMETVEEVNVKEIGIKIRSGLTSGNWAEKGDQIFDILASFDKPVVLLMDEIPILINEMLKGQDYRITPERKQAVHEFMSWLRKNSLQHQGNIRIVLSGSIGLEAILRQANLTSTINNFASFKLKPWDEETAEAFLNEIAHRYDLHFDEGVTGEMLKHLGCLIPHHVQMFFSSVREWCKRKGTNKVTLEDVEMVYKGEMLSVSGHAELAHYEERLEKVLGKEQFAIALDILTETAVTGSITREVLQKLPLYHEILKSADESLLKEILWVLEHDGYLEQKEDRYVFVSLLLKDWFKARHEFFFTPILKRGG
jgi:hypothetical protein